MAISQKVLNQLLAQSLVDSTKEPAFFRALLDAMLFAHTPKGPPTSHVRFMQFVTPDGITALPVFTDRGKAEFASRGHARVVTLLGRDLFEATRGATIAINPNDRWCLLYPEEIAQLLATGEAAVVAIETVPQSLQVASAIPEAPPHWLIEILQSTFAEHPSVESAYLVELRLTTQMEVPRLLVGVVMPKANEERVCRAAVTALQLRYPDPGCAIDLVRVDPEGELPEWLSHPKPEPFYRREWAAALKDNDGPGPLGAS